MSVRKFKEYLNTQDDDFLRDELLTLYKTFDVVRQFYTPRIEPSDVEKVVQKYNFLSNIRYVYQFSQGGYRVRATPTLELLGCFSLSNVLLFWSVDGGLELFFELRPSCSSSLAIFSRACFKSSSRR